MKAKLIKKDAAEAAEEQAKRKPKKPVAPRNGVSQWITQYNLTKLTPQTARQQFAALFAPASG